MFIYISFIFISFLLVFLLNVVSFFISEKVILNREELSSYECGFEHHNLSRIPFSLRYFFLTLIFLLFDLEIIFIIFLPFVLVSSMFYFAILVSLLFVFILFFSLMYEWNDGSLEWLN